MPHKQQLKKAFDKTQLVQNEIAVLVQNKQYVSAFVLKFLFLEQFLEMLISIIYLQLNGDRATQLLELARDDASDTTFGHKVMHLQKLNKRFGLGIGEALFRDLQKISSFRNKTVHRLLHSDVDINILNKNSQQWIAEIDSLHKQLFVAYLKK